MKLYLTGGAGFIGYHLTKRLLAEGHSVVAVDNLNDYYDVSLKHARISMLRDFPGFEFRKLDILNYDEQFKLLKRDPVDGIIHLAALAGVRYSLDHGLDYVRTNYEGTYNIFELARHLNIPKVVYASSSSVYGRSTSHPTVETDNTDRPIALYGATKKATESLAHTYWDAFGVKSVGLRFFTVYGPWGRPDMALFIFTKSIIEESVMEVNNNGEMTRDFTYVDDIVSGIRASLDYDTTYDIFNLGSGQQVKLIEFIQLIERYVGKSAQIKMMPLPLGDIKDSLADVTRARSLLNYEPSVFTEEGVGRFVEWYRNYYKV